MGNELDREKEMNEIVELELEVKAFTYKMLEERRFTTKTIVEHLIEAMDKETLDEALWRLQDLDNRP